MLMMTMISCNPMMRGQLDPKPRETSTWENWLDKVNKSDLSLHLNDDRSVTNPRLIFPMQYLLQEMQD